VSRLSYDGARVRRRRHHRTIVAGVAPDLVAVDVGNAVLSRPEVLEVERLARSVIGRQGPGAETAPAPLRADKSS
jgi:hypothetical protein